MLVAANVIINVLNECEDVLKSDRLCGSGYSFIQMTVFMLSIQDSHLWSSYKQEKCAALKVLRPQICMNDAMDNLNLMMV